MFETFDNDAKMDQAKQARTTAKGQFTRAKRSLTDALNLSDVPISTVERRFNELKKKWDMVQETHDAYSVHSGEMEVGEADKLDEWIDEMITTFDDLEIKADKKIDQIRSTEAPSPKDKDSKKRSEVGAVKVERMKFPQFEGDIRRYPQFKEEFIKHIGPICQKDQLAFVLKNHLSPIVREEVESCGEDYTEIWKRLDQRFGDEGRLINSIMDEVTNLSHGGNDDSYTLQMIKTVEKAHRDLVRLGAEQEMCNASTIVMIEKKMPIAMKQEWAKNVAGKSLSSKRKFEMLMEYLQAWRNQLEYLSDSVRTVPELKGRVSHVRGEEMNGSNSYTRQKCWIHQMDEHPIWRCREFLVQPVEERIRLVEKYKACKVCLVTTCPGSASSSDCKSRFRCRADGCGEHHSRFLHVTKKELSGSSSHAEGEVGVPGSTLLQIQSL